VVERIANAISWDEQFESGIQASTPEQIRQAHERIHDPAKLVIVSAGDFGKAGN
jgi:hypothetical protein